MVAHNDFYRESRPMCDVIALYGVHDETGYQNPTRRSLCSHPTSILTSDEMSKKTMLEESLQSDPCNWVPLIVGSNAHYLEQLIIR